MQYIKNSTKRKYKIYAIRYNIGEYKRLINYILSDIKECESLYIWEETYMISHLMKEL